MPLSIFRTFLRPVRLAMFAPILLAGCATAVPTPPRDAHIPDFARIPYEPFSRQAAVEIALREWRLFGQRVQDEPPGALPSADPLSKPERLDGMWQRVGEYWWLGLDSGNREHGWTGRHDERGGIFPADEDGQYAWSAAFISYVMRMAGAARRFPYSGSHSDYINRAREVSLGRSGTPWAISAERPEAYAPTAGDLICTGRGSGRAMIFDMLPARPFPGHCDIVVAQQPGELTVIGGNVDDAVTMKHVPTSEIGTIAGPGGATIDTRHPWFVVIRMLYDR